MRCPVAVKNERRVLCVFPPYTPSFGTFQHAYKLMYRVKAFMPPQGLLLIAAYMPESWPVRFIDENIARATEADFAWADVVLVTGMHIQAPQIRDIEARAHAAGKAVVLGGPSVSASPEMYPDRRLSPHRRARRRHRRDRARCSTRARRGRARADGVQDRGTPAAHRFPDAGLRHDPLGKYLMGTMQFSTGCPYTCEFCDIPGLYGRQPRMKTPQQIIAELDSMRSQPKPPPRSTSSTTISSATARPPRRCCRIWSNGRRGTVIRCSSPARRR